MNKSLKSKKNIFFIIFLIINSLAYTQSNLPPEITASGNQVFCPGNSINIATDFTITDPDDTTIDVFYIQISSGYQFSFDQLSLTNHPTIKGLWSGTEGKLTLLSKITVKFC